MKKEEILNKLIDEIVETQDVMEGYPINPDGTKDFSGEPIERPLTRKDVEYLVGEYAKLREAKTGHDEAVRLTYGCAYCKSDCRFNPHARIAELREQNKK